MTTTASIAQVLTSTLNPDSNIRISAELSLSELLKSPRERLHQATLFQSFLTRLALTESALSLAQLILSRDAESSLRQMSLV